MKWRILINLFQSINTSYYIKEKIQMMSASWKFPLNSNQFSCLCQRSTLYSRISLPPCFIMRFPVSVHYHPHLTIVGSPSSSSWASLLSLDDLLIELSPCELWTLSFELFIATLSPFLFLFCLPLQALFIQYAFTAGICLWDAGGGCLFWLWLVWVFYVTVFPLLIISFYMF